MQFDYYIPTRIVFKRGALNELHEQELPGKKALVVMSQGKSTRANGYFDRLCGELDLAGVAYVVFDKILPNPIKKHVMEGAKLAKENGCDFIIGLGGGSSMDAAKAISLMATNEGDYWDYMLSGSGKGKEFKNPPLPVVTVSTTAGTGTESDKWAVTTNEETEEKIGYGSDLTYPVLSVVDPELTLSVPPHLTAYQGFDVFFHCSEGYISKGASAMSDIFALKAISLIAENLPKAVADGSNIEARENIMFANILAGFVESISSCTSEHALEHALSAYHPDLPHGAGLILISVAYFRNFADAHACDDRLIDMAKAMGKKDAASPTDFVDALYELQKACNVADIKMSDYGMVKGELEKYVKNALDTMGGLFVPDPAPVSPGDALRILEESYS